MTHPTTRMTTMTLTLSTGSFDSVNTFTVEVAGRRGPHQITCALVRDYKRDGDGIYWGMQRGAMVKARYTAADVAETERLSMQVPVRNGDVVTIAGASYVARVMGDYSDAVVFDPVEAGC